MKNKTTRFILSSWLILTLLLGTLSAIAPASPVQAATLNVVPFALTTSGTGTAQWTTADSHTGSYSVELTTTGSGDYAGLGIDAYGGTIDGITSLSFWYKHISYAGFCGPRMALTLTRAPNYYMAMTGCAVDSAGWKNADAINGVQNTDWYTSGTGNQIWWYGTWDGSNPATYSQLGGPITFAALQGLLTGATVNNVAVYMGWVDGINVLAGSAYVDDPVINGTIYAGMLQEAIDAATAGDTITCQAGAFTEDLTIDKGLTIQGSGSATSTITGTHTVTASDVSISDFTLAITGSATVIKIDSSAGMISGFTVEDCIFNMPVGPAIGVSIGYQVASPLKVSDVNINRNTFNGPATKAANPWKIGGEFGTPNGCEVENLTFQGNTVNRCSIPINLDDQNITDILIDDNTFANTDGVVYIWEQSTETPTGVLSQFVFTNNGMSVGNTYGVAFIDQTAAASPFTDANFGSGNVINYNDFSNISGGYGLQAVSIFGTFTTFTLNAEFNYWGNASGPSHIDATLGAVTYGSAVSTRVDFMPWLVAVYSTPPTGEIDITTTSPLPDGQIGVAYSEPLAATGGTGTYTWAYYGPGVCAECSFPPGLTVGAGVISGTPTLTHLDPDFRFGIQVRDGVQGTYQTYELSVYASPLSITTSTLPNGVVGTAYSETLQAAGGIGSYTWSKYTGSLPTGLTITPATGVIAGTPTTIGTYDFRAKVVSGAQVAYKDLSIVIISALQVTNSTGESLVTPTSARLNGEIISTGGENPTVHIYWGDNNGGTTPGNWDHDVPLGPKGLGTFFTDISGLTPSTPYYYICFATNSGSSDWADSTESFTTLSESTLQKLLGADDAAAVGPVGANYLVLDKWTALATGNVYQIRVKATGAGNVKVGLYTDVTGSPGILMNANDTGASVVAGWNTINLPTTAVTMGTDYWIAYNSTANCVGYFSSPGGGLVFRALTYATLFPASAGTVFTPSPDYRSLSAAWGVVGPIPLTITTTSLPDGVIDTPYLQTLTAIGGTGTYTWSVFSGGLPAGLTLTPGTGVIDGTPTTFGTSNFTVEVDDGPTSVTQLLSITITAPVDKLLGADDAVAVGPAGANYLLFDKWTAVATGSVTQIRVKCTASGNVKVALYTDVTVSPGTLINANETGASVVAGWNTISLPLTPVTIGTDYWIAYNSTANCVGYFSSPGGGLVFRALGYATPFPASAGTVFTPSPDYRSLSAAWGVVGPVPLTITTTSLPEGSVGVLYNQTLNAIGGTGTYTWSIPVGALPDGLALTPATGVINGTPTATGTFDFTAEVDDGVTTATQPLSIVITNLQRLLGATDVAAVGPAGANYLVLDKWTAVATGNVTQIRVKCMDSGTVKVGIYADTSGIPGTLIVANEAGASVVPGWNTISLTSTPVISGTDYWIAYNSSANCVGYYSSPGGGLIFRSLTYATIFPSSAGTGFSTSSGNHSLTAAWGAVGPMPLTITTTSLPEGMVGVPYNQTLHAIGGTETYTWSIIPPDVLPDGLALTPATGVIDGTPTTLGNYDFTVQVNDGVTTDTQPLSINITNLQRIFGATDLPPVGPAGGNYLVLDKWTALATGSVSEIRVKCVAPGSVKVALYTDVTGSPGTLIAVNNIGASVVVGWNNISLTTPTPVIIGTDYWIAYNSSANCVGYYSSPGGGLIFRYLTYATSFPSPAGTGFATSTNNHSLTAAWGAAGPIALTITTTSLPEGAIGVPYSQTLLAIGGTGSYTWSIIPPDALPDGLALTPATGVIDGTPTANGYFAFTAQVDDGVTTDIQLLSIFVPNMQKLLGADDAEPVGPAGANFMVLDKYTAIATGSVTSIRLKCTAPGNVKVALYSDSSGSPGSILGVNNPGASVVDGWNNISLPSTAVEMGTDYWIAYNTSTNCVGYFSLPGGGLVFKYLFFGTAFPYSAGNGFTTSSGNHSLSAGFGSVAAPLLVPSGTSTK